MLKLEKCFWLASLYTAIREAWQLLKLFSANALENLPLVSLAVWIAARASRMTEQPFSTDRLQLKAIWINVEAHLLIA